MESVHGQEAGTFAEGIDERGGEGGLAGTGRACDRDHEPMRRREFAGEPLDDRRDLDGEFHTEFLAQIPPGTGSKSARTLRDWQTL